MRLCENDDCVIMRLLRNGEIDGMRQCYRKRQNLDENSSILEFLERHYCLYFTMSYNSLFSVVIRLIIFATSKYYDFIRINTYKCTSSQYIYLIRREWWNSRRGNKCKAIYNMLVTYPYRFSAGGCLSNCYNVFLLIEYILELIFL